MNGSEKGLSQRCSFFVKCLLTCAHFDADYVKNKPLFAIFRREESVFRCQFTARRWRLVAARAAQNKGFDDRQSRAIRFRDLGSGQFRKHNARHWPYYFIGEKSVGRMYVESTFSTVFSVCSDFTTA
jgi:hypothetical protein